ncbi:Uncharacterized protein FKW44_019055, partial [Caligus rogercresseyi]
SPEDRLSAKSSYDESPSTLGSPFFSLKALRAQDSISIFDSVSFQSPIEDLSPASREAVRLGILSPPVPAPRGAKREPQIYENVEMLLQNKELLQNGVRRRKRNEEVYEDIKLSRNP